MHRGQVRARSAALETEADRLRRQRLDMPRRGVVGLVAMEIDEEAALGRDLAERNDGSRAVRRRALEMRNATDDLDAKIERALEIGERPRRAVDALLREGDELQVEI